MVPGSLCCAQAAHLGTPFVWQRDDGSLGVMQTWPTNFNAKFKGEFEIAEVNPDPKIYSEEAAAEFGQCCAALFGAPATPGVDSESAPPVPVLYCHRASKNDKPVYVGTCASLLAFLRGQPQVVHALNVISLTDDGFVAGTVDGKGNTGTKDFSMAPEVEYALYTKLGWHTMACVTPLEQFEKDRDLGGECRAF